MFMPHQIEREREGEQSNKKQGARRDTETNPKAHTDTANTTETPPLTHTQTRDTTHTHKKKHT